jgi:hypothetical protein
MRGKDTCRGCGSENLIVGLNLGFSPLANRLIEPEMLEAPEAHFPLTLRICSTCGLGQLGEFASAQDIFGRDYPYLSSTSEFWLSENQVFAKEMVETLELGPDDLIIEIASNDGYLLRFWAEMGLKVLGVEPALNVATLAACRGIPTSPEFFGKQLALKLKEEVGSPRLLVAKNVLAHVPDLRDFLSGIANLVDKSTLVVVEAPTISQILRDGQFDTIYHEHFSYLSIHFFKHILREFNLVLRGVEKVRTHGGSMRFFITSTTSIVSIPPSASRALEEEFLMETELEITNEVQWAKLQNDVDFLLQSFRQWLQMRTKPIVGYGAAAKAVTLLSASQAPRASISMIIDNSKAKAGKYLPGTHTKIMSESEFLNLEPQDCDFIIFPWNLAGEIKERIRKFTDKGDIYIVLPKISEV